jgi:cystathionine beta-lyase/cystathionine gamma-synthase
MPLSKLQASRHKLLRLDEMKRTEEIKRVHEIKRREEKRREEKKRLHESERMQQMNREVDNMSSKMNAISKTASELSTTADKLLSDTKKYSWPMVKKSPYSQKMELEVPLLRTQGSMEDLPRVLGDLNASTKRSTSPLYSLVLENSHLNELSGNLESLVK